MSKENPQKQEAKKPGKVTRKAAALLLSAGLVTGVGAVKAAEKVTPTEKYAVNHEVSVNSISKAAELSIANDLASEHWLDVADGVTAVVQFKDGSHLNIDNPIVEQVRTQSDYANSRYDVAQVAVAERTRGPDAGEDSIVTAYTVGEGDVQDILYLGQDLYQEGEHDIKHIELSPMPLARFDGLSDEGQTNYFVVNPIGEDSPSGANTSMKVAQGQLYS